MGEKASASGGGQALARNPKLNIPRLRPNRVRRRHLLSRLNAGLDRPLTLLSAPAGFGKTTLLAEWAHAARQQRNVAWLSLDAEDNDPAQFMMLIKSAFAQMNESWRRALETFEPSVRSSPSSTMLSLLSSIDHVPFTRSVLVLDDYHWIADSWIDSAVACLIEYLPPPLHLVISTRVDPSLALARLRARDQVAEIRAADLKLSRDEAGIFLKRVMNLHLSRAEIETLYERTEGWVAGLQLVALALRTPSSQLAPADLSSLTAHLTGNHPLIADYLAQEIIARQSPAVRDFLLKTSLLERLAAPLCDALLQTENAQAILDHLNRANVFLVPLDDERRWYRYHVMFREWLHGQLEQTQPHEIPELHRRAAQWFAQHELVLESIRHLLSACDYEAAADQIERQAGHMLEQGQACTLLTWLDGLPRDLVWSRLPLCLAYASALNTTRQVQRVGPYVLRAKELLKRTSCRRQAATRQELHQYRTRLAMIQAATAMWQGDLREMIEHSKEALALVPRSASTARANIASNLVYGHIMAGHVLAARQAVTAAERESRTARNPRLALSVLNCQAMVQVAAGELKQASRTCRRAVEIADSEFSGRMGSYSLILLGDILREWNDLPQALECLTEGIERDRRAGALGSHAALLHLARTLAAQGQFAQALEQLERAEAVMVTRGADRWETQAAAFRARLMIMQGQVDEARNWAKTCGIHLSSPHIESPIPGYLPEIEYLTLVRLHLAEHNEPERHGDLNLVRQWLHALKRDAERKGRYGSLIEILVLQSLLYDTLDEETRALATLRHALSLGAPDKYVRVFLDEGAEMLALLSRLVERDNDAYARRLIAAVPVHGDQHAASGLAATEALTSHELRVLRLIARGLSNQEIADELHVSLNTVRTHTQHLFQKLAVHNRTSAVRVARDQGWL